VREDAQRERESERERERKKERERERKIEKEREKARARGQRQRERKRERQIKRERQKETHRSGGDVGGSVLGDGEVAFVPYSTHVFVPYNRSFLSRNLSSQNAPQRRTC
jgi:hypothetical protein